MADETVGTGADTLYALGDHLGTIRDIANLNESTSATTVTNHRTYNSFGKLVSETNTAVDLIFGYTGKQLDDATGLQHNLFRWYDSSLGQWVNEDPLGLHGGDENLLRYCGNGTASRLDFDGRTWSYFFDAFADSYFDYVNPWDDVSTPPVDGIDAVLRYGTMTGQAAAAAALAIVAVYAAAPAILSAATTVSTNIAAASSSVAVQTQIAMATPTGFWVARNGPQIIETVADMASGYPGLGSVGVGSLDDALVQAGKMRGAQAQFIGAADNVFGSTRQMIDLPVTLQPTNNTCVASALDMLIPTREFTIIEMHKLSKLGASRAYMASFLQDNIEAAGLKFMRGSFDDALASGHPFITVVDEGHAVLVDGVKMIGNIKSVIVRDPAVGAYTEGLEWFQTQRVVDPAIMNLSSFWGT